MVRLRAIAAGRGPGTWRGAVGIAVIATALIAGCSSPDPGPEDAGTSRDTRLIIPNEELAPAEERLTEAIDALVEIETVDVHLSANPTEGRGVRITATTPLTDDDEALALLETLIELGWHNDGVLARTVAVRLRADDLGEQLVPGDAGFRHDGHATDAELFERYGPAPIDPSWTPDG